MINVSASERQRQSREVAVNLNNHVSKSMVRYIASACETDQDLRTKCRSGILKDVKSSPASSLSRMTCRYGSHRLVERKC